MMDSDSGGLKVELDFAPQSHVCRLCWKPWAPHVHLQFHASTPDILYGWQRRFTLQMDLLRMICFLQGELGIPSWLEGSVHSHFSTSGQSAMHVNTAVSWMNDPSVVGLNCHSADMGYLL